MIHHVIEPLEARIAPATISVFSPAPVNEGNSGSHLVKFTVTLSDDDMARTDAITVHYTTADGNDTIAANNATTADNDYVAKTGSLSFAPAVRDGMGNITTPAVGSLDVMVQVNSDTKVESNEVFRFTLDTPSANATLGMVAEATHTILDDDVKVSITGGSVLEGNGGTGVTPNMIAFQVTLAQASTHEIRVNYSTVNGTAVAGTDFTGIGSTELIFAAGDTTKTVMVAVTGNLTPSADKTLQVQLAAPTGAALDSTKTSATGTILNDDFNFALRPVSVLEADTGSSTKAFVPVTLDYAVPAGYNLVLEYVTADGTAKSGSDYTKIVAGDLTANPVVPPTSITIPAGQKTGFLPVSVLGDNTAEGNENFQVKLVKAHLETVGATVTKSDVAVSANTLPATVIITDNEKPDVKVQFAASSPTVLEGNTTPSAATFVASLSSAVQHDVVVTYHVSGSTDPNEATHPLMVTIPAGQTAQTFTVAYAGDSVVGHDRDLTATIDLVTVTGGNDPGITVEKSSDAAKVTAKTRILDDDAKLTLSAADMLSEGTGIYHFTATLSAKVDHDVIVTYSTIDGTAISAASGTNRQDFVGKTNATATIPAGQTQVDLPITIVNDTLAGPDETFSVKITGATGAAPVVAADGTKTVTILNDDGNQGLSVANVTVKEGDTAGFVIKLAKASENDITVTYAVAAVTASAAQFTTPTTTTLTIPAGSTTGIIPVATKDAGNDPQGTFSVKLTNAVYATGGGVPTNNLTAIGTINPVALPQLSVADVKVAEDSGMATFTVTLPKAQTHDVIFYADTIDGTAKAPSDYTPLVHQKYTILAGQTSIEVKVPITADQTVEPDETFSLKLSLSGDPTKDTAVLGSNPVATGTIQNDENKFTVTASAATVLENAGFAIFTVSRAGTDLSQAATVRYTTVNGTATGGQDFIPTSDKLTFAAGQSEITFKVPITDDSRHEADETFQLVISDPTNAVLGTATAATVTIQDDDAIPKININSPTITEGNSGTKNLDFTVTLERANDVPLVDDPATTDINESQFATIVHYSTMDGTAKTGTDYTATTGTLYFKVGETSKTISVPIIGNAIQNAVASKTFSVNLADDAKGGTLVTASGTGMITDDDAAPVVSISSASAIEGGQEQFTVTLSNASEVPIKVMYYTKDGTAVSGATKDYLGVPMPTGNDAPHFITIPAGATTGTITIDTVPTDVAGPNKTFQVVLSGVQSAPPTGGTALAVSLSPTAKTATGTIVNDIVEQVSINDFSILEGSNGFQIATFTVSLSNPTAVPVMVKYNTKDGTATVAGSDYLAQTGTLLFAANGVTEQIVKIQVRGDNQQEADETFSVVLSSPTNAILGRATGTGTILNDDNGATLNLADASTLEGDSILSNKTLSFLPTLTSATDHDVTFTLSTAAFAGVAATPNVDFLSATRTFTILKDHTTPTKADGSPDPFVVTIFGDTIFEATENFSVKVTNLVGAIGGKTTATGTIISDDILITPRAARWIDTDGDLVTLTVSKGTLQRGMFSFGTVNALGGRSLDKLDLSLGGQQFLRANVSIQAVAQPGLPAALAAMGDGRVNVGTIQSNTNATGNQLELVGVDLGAVAVDGDLGAILAGDLFNDLGVGSLHVYSFGKLSPGQISVVTEGIGAMVVDTDFSGTLQVLGQQFGVIKSLIIGGKLQGTAVTNSGIINTTGAIGNVQIGAIVGGTDGLGGATGILSAASISTLKVLGNLDNTDGIRGGAGVSASSIGSATVGGSIIGGSIRVLNSIQSLTVAGDLRATPGDSPVVALISAGAANQALGLKSVVITGQVDGAQILAGFDAVGTAVTADAQIGTVLIGGNVRALDIVAGAAPGSDGVYGIPVGGTVADDVPLSVNVSDSSTLFSRIARVVIGGTVTADSSAHGIVAQFVDSVTVGGIVVPLTGVNGQQLPIGTGTNFSVVEVGRVAF